MATGPLGGGGAGGSGGVSGTGGGVNVFDAQRLFAANSTNNTAPALTDLAYSSPPTPGNGVILGGPGGVTQPTLQIMPYGRAGGGTATYWVYGWTKIRSRVDDPVQWHPVCLFQFPATFSTTFAGIAGGLVTDSDFYADTIGDPVAGHGTLNVDFFKKTPGANRGAVAILVVNNFEMIQVVPQRGTATQVNGIYRFAD